jgi:hypothetical protein
METIEILSINNISQARVKIVFRRRIEFHLTGTFLQTTTLILIGYLTLLFDIDNFTDRIMVVLTTLLVVATITTSMTSVSSIINYFYSKEHEYKKYNTTHLSDPAQDLILQDD